MPSMVDFLNHLYDSGKYIRRVSYGSNVFCPFHVNVNTPAAKIFRDLDGDRLYCFSCNKQFTYWDLVKLHGTDAEKMAIPTAPPSQPDFVRMNFSYLDGFKRGDFTIKDVFRRLKEMSNGN